MNKPLRWTSAALLLGAISACGGGSTTSETPPNPTPTITTPTALPSMGPVLPSDLSAIPSATSGDVDEDSGETITPQPAPTWDEQTRHRANEAAEAAMTAFARPFLDYQTWWAELSPLLTQQAQQDYAYIDPANVPVHGVVGDARITDQTSTYVATVTVPTDVGPYLVTVTRTDATASWLVASITPPEGVN